ncbi:MAG: hypothetical protein LQ342_001009 [Letrouitia transgressa]|nr:MAG: hypothetical protein LQ342_001009 [Letrouitia transgressa]
MDHAREEYLFQYSVFVLENLIPLTLFRPLRLFVNSEQLRSARIILLKATHLPYVGAIWAYERTSRFWNEKKEDWLGASGTQKRAMIASHISFSHKAMKYPAHRNRSEVSLMAKRRGSETRPNSAKETEMLTETRKMMEKLKWQGEMIEKLSEQVETLTRRIAPEPKDEGRRAT